MDCVAHPPAPSIAPPPPVSLAPYVPCPHMSLAPRLLYEVFRHIKVSPRRFAVEFGARKPNVLNSAHLREHCGWQTLLLDPFPNANGTGWGKVHKEMVTPENINRIFAKYDVPRVFDMLTLDDDSNEYWAW